MFGSNAGATGHSNSGVVVRPDIVPVPFVWPYGGREVFLCGSFSGWSEQILMSPMEGCPTAFQVLCYLSPGVHEYKFWVDGQWRHDENRPVATKEFQLVNTVVVTREHALHTVYAPGPPSQVNMEVDDTANRTVTSSDGVLGEQIPENALQISRQRISLFLSQHTAYELLPESGKVVALDVTLPVKQAFHILYEQGVPVAPLWDFGKGQFVGVLSAIDFILILKELGKHGSNLTEEELETHPILAWKDGKYGLNGHTGGSGRPFGRQLVYAGPYDSLKDVALKILQNKISTVPIIHSSSPDGSFPQLLHLASLSGILKCICRHFKNSTSSLPILLEPIDSLPLGTWLPVPTLTETSHPPVSFSVLNSLSSLGDALEMLCKADVSSIPIVDDEYSLVDVFSRSDITSLAKDRAYAQIRLDELTIVQALQLGQEANAPGAFNPKRCQMCLRTDTLKTIMDRLAIPGVRRLVVVEAGKNRVQGIITLSDVLKFLLS